VELNLKYLTKIKMKTFLNRLDQKYLSLGIAFVICLLVAAGIHAANAQTGPSASPPNGGVTPTFSGLSVTGVADFYMPLKNTSGAETPVIIGDNLQVDGNSELKGTTNIVGGMTVTGFADFRIPLKNMLGAETPVAIGDNLQVDGDSALNGDLEVAGNTKLGDNPKDLTSVVGQLVGPKNEATGGFNPIDIRSSLQNSGGVNPLTISDDLSITGDTTIDGHLKVDSIGNFYPSQAMIGLAKYEVNGATAFCNPGDTPIRCLYSGTDRYVTVFQLTEQMGVLNGQLVLGCKAVGRNNHWADAKNLIVNTLCFDTDGN